MNRLVEKSKVVLVLLAGLVILLHATIPHHHHFDASCEQNYTNSDKDQCCGESSTQGNEHCHTLNTIILQKVSSLTLDNNTAVNSLLFFILSNEEEDFHNRVSLISHVIKDVVVLQQYLSSEPSFRGPPTIV